MKGFARIANLFCIGLALGVVLFFVRDDLNQLILSTVYLDNDGMEAETNLAISPGKTEHCTLSIQKGAVNDIWFKIGQDHLAIDGIHITITDTEGREIINRFLTPEDILSVDQGKKIVTVYLSFGDLEDGLLSIGEYDVFISNPTNTAIYVKLKNSGEDRTLNIGSARRTSIGKYFAIMIVALLWGYLIIIFSLKQITPSKFFVVTASVLGFVYMLLTVIWSVPDSSAHFYATYRLSNVLLRQENEWDGRKDDVEFLSASMYSNRNSGIRDYIVLQTFLNRSSSEVELVPLPEKAEHMKFYSIFSYLPQTVGLTIGRLFMFGPVLSIYLARVIALLCYILFCWHAIEVTPIGKWVFSFIPLLPVPLIFASSFSYDTVVLLVTFNFTASVFRLKNTETLKASYLFEAGCWSFLLGAIKGGGYIVMLPLLFILTLKKPKNKRTIAVCCLLALVSVLLFDVVLPKGMHLFQLGGQEGFLSAEFAFKHPAQFFKMTMQAYMVYFDFNILNLGGVNLAYSLPTSNPTLSLTLLTSMLGLCILSGLYETDNSTYTRADCYIFALVTLLTFVTTPIMLLSWTPEGSRTLEGIQGRYFLPVLPLIILLLSKHWLVQVDLQKRDSQIAMRRLSVAYGILLIVNAYFFLRIFLTIL